MTVVNLTPHTLHVHTGRTIDGAVEVIEIAPDPAGPARVTVDRAPLGHVAIGGAAIRAYAQTPGEVVDLPDPTPGTLYVVSAMVADAVRRLDVVSPGTLVRDGEGRVVGLSDFTRWPPKSARVHVVVRGGYARDADDAPPVHARVFVTAEAASAWVAETEGTQPSWDTVGDTSVYRGASPWTMRTTEIC